ncbi:MAG: hypothetical protein ACR2I1_04945 [Propionibacteriaceae bacterium]
MVSAFTAAAIEVYNDKKIIPTHWTSSSRPNPPPFSADSPGTVSSTNAAAKMINNGLRPTRSDTMPAIGLSCG